jgi:hypothetical protein
MNASCSDEVDETTFLRAVVVLCEFSKELAAIVQVKLCEPRDPPPAAETRESKA